MVGAQSGCGQGAALLLLLLLLLLHRPLLHLLLRLVHLMQRLRRGARGRAESRRLLHLLLLLNLLHQPLLLTLLNLLHLRVESVESVESVEKMLLHLHGVQHRDRLGLTGPRPRGTFGF
jgi:hypothetical protein